MKKKLIILASLYFLLNIGTNLGHPVTSAYLNSLEIPNFIFGIMFSSMSLGMVIGATLFGRLSDRIGRKGIIVFGIILYSLSQFAFGSLNKNMYIMVIIRFIAGIGISAPSALFITEAITLTDGKKRTNFLAVLAALAVLGSSISYKLMGNLNVNGLSFYYVFLIQSLYMAFVAFLTVVLLKSDKNIEIEHTKKQSILDVIKDYKNLGGVIVFFLVIMCFITVAQVDVTKYLDVLVTDLYDPKVLGDFVFITGIVSIVVSLVLVPVINKRGKPVLYLALVQILSCVAIIITFTFYREKIMVMLYTVFMFYVILKAFTAPLEQTVFAECANKENYGMVMGTRQSFIALGQVIGPIIGGALYETNPYAVFYLCGVIFGVTGLLLVGYRHKLKTN